MSTEEMGNALSICEEYGVKMSILPRYSSLRFAKLKFEEVGETGLITFVTYNYSLPHSILKVFVDKAMAAFALILFGPVMVVAAVAIKLDSPGSVLFRQKRCGMNGRVFDLYKFRSMHMDAEKRKMELMALNESSGPTFKIKDDPRITSVGRWLRKFSLDELPQLVNVLKGDMSVVGPRPPLPSEVEKYERWQRRRLSVKPGLTCTWQVFGRNRVGFEEWVRLDLDYIDNWTLARDFELILKTLPVMIKGTGV